MGTANFGGSAPPPRKNIGAIKTKSGTNDYVGEGNPHAKFGNIPITGGFFPYRWNITFWASPNNFFNVMLIFRQGYRWDRWTDFDAQYLKTHVSAGSAYLCMSKQKFHNFRGQTPLKLPKIGPNRHFAAKSAKS